jgi:hypothetical protein
MQHRPPQVLINTETDSHSIVLCQLGGIGLLVRGLQWVELGSGEEVLTWCGREQEAVHAFFACHDPLSTTDQIVPVKVVATDDYEFAYEPISSPVTILENAALLGFRLMLQRKR